MDTLNDLVDTISGTLEISSRAFYPEKYVFKLLEKAHVHRTKALTHDSHITTTNHFF